MALLEDDGFVVATSSILGKVQTAQGSPASPAAADGFRAFDVDVQNEIEVIERMEQVGVMGRPISPGAGKASRILTFKSLLTGWGDTWSDQPPELDALLRCAMLAATADGTNETVQYDPISTGEEWSTFKVCWEEVYHLLTDCQANLKFSAAVGEPMVVDASVYGQWNDLADAAVVNPSGLHDTIAPKLKAATVQLGSDTLPISSFEFDMGNVIGARPDPNSTHGILGFITTNRNPVVTFDPEMVKVATFDYESYLLGSTTEALTVTLGADTGNTITFYFGQLQITGLAPAVDNDIRRYTVTANPRYSSGDDEFYIKFE